MVLNGIPRIGIRITTPPPGKVKNSGFSQQSLSLDNALLEAAPLTLRETAPDSKALIVGEGILQALVANLTTQANPLRFPGRATFLREKGFRIGLRAEGAVLPLFMHNLEEFIKLSRYQTKSRPRLVGASNFVTG